MTVLLCILVLLEGIQGQRKVEGMDPKLTELSGPLERDHAGAGWGSQSEHPVVSPQQGPAAPQQQQETELGQSPAAAQQRVEFPLAAQGEQFVTLQIKARPGRRLSGTGPSGHAPEKSYFGGCHPCCH